MRLRHFALVALFNTSACNALVGIGEPSDRHDASLPPDAADGSTRHDASDGADHPPDARDASSADIFVDRDAAGGDASSADASVDRDAAGGGDASDDLDGAGLDRIDEGDPADAADAADLSDAADGLDASERLDARQEADAREGGIPDSGGVDVVSPPDAETDGGTSTIRYRSSWLSDWQDVDSITIQTPPFVAENDLLWLALYTDLETTEATEPAGWTRVTDRSNAVQRFRSWWFYRFAVAREPLERVFTFNQKTLSWAGIVAYSGVDTTMPFDRGTVSDLRGTPCVAPSIQPARGSGLMFLLSIVHDGSNTFAPIDAMSVRGAHAGIFLADFPQEGPGGTGTKSISCPPGGDGHVSIVGLVPARL